MDGKKEAKRYYWLKLKATYFNQLGQRKMKKQENGKEMQIIYLRMMLASIDKEGVIYYQGVYDTLEEELAEEFDEDIEIVKETLKYLQDNNMISINDNFDCFIPEAMEYTGSECYSAERMRRMRKKNKTSQCDTDVTACDEETETEKEKEIDTEQDDLSVVLFSLNELMTIVEQHKVNLSENGVKAFYSEMLKSGWVLYNKPIEKDGIVKALRGYAKYNPNTTNGTEEKHSVKVEKKEVLPESPVMDLWDDNVGWETVYTKKNNEK